MCVYVSIGDECKFFHEHYTNLPDSEATALEIRERQYIYIYIYILTMKKITNKKQQEVRQRSVDKKI